MTTQTVRTNRKVTEDRNSSLISALSAAEKGDDVRRNTRQYDVQKEEGRVGYIRNDSRTALVGVEHAPATLDVPIYAPNATAAKGARVAKRSSSK